MHDLIILGTGPAGLSAAIYAARYRMDFIVIGQLWGGAATEAHKIGNYPGIEDITGSELGQRMLDHAKTLGVEIVADQIQKIKEKNGTFVLHSSSKGYEAKRILLALGTERTKLLIPGEDEFLGKGVAYCATCDGPFFKDKTVCVMGGGDAAVTSALYLGDIAAEVYLIYRGDKLKAEPGWLEKLGKAENIEVILNANATKITGEERVESIELDNGQIIKTDGIFIEIGSTPNKALLSDIEIKTDEKGYIYVDSEMKTNVKNVWAAGDITSHKFKLRQIVVAASEGAISAYSAYLDTKKEGK